MSAPLGYEIRFWPEFARLLADARFWTPTRPPTSAGRPSARSPAGRPSARPPEQGDRRRPVLLIPGFLAGDSSLTVLAGWLRRRGHEVRTSGIRLNVGCAGRELKRLRAALDAFGEPAVVIGQSRGGTLARALAARHPDSIAAVMTLGSPVLDQLAVSPSVLRTVRSVAFLGDLGIRGLFTNECRDGRLLLGVPHAAEGAAARRRARRRRVLAQRRDRRLARLPRSRRRVG